MEIWVGGLASEPAFSRIKREQNGVLLSLQLKVSTAMVFFNKADLLHLT